MLTAFLFKKHLEEDETLVTVVHKYWLLGVKSVAWPTIFIAADIVMLLLFHERAVLLAGILLFLVFAVWWLRNFLDYYLDAWIITDHGIIDVTWFGWFHRQSTRILYSDIQGVSYEIKGVLGTLFRFGTMSVEKISNGASVFQPFVYRPKRTEFLILRQMEAYLHAKNMKDSKQVQELLASLVAQQMQLQELHDSSD